MAYTFSETGYTPEGYLEVPVTGGSSQSSALGGMAAGAAAGSSFGPYGALIGAGIGALGSFMGGQSANRANAAESARNRAFQERMSSTAYQRASKDLEAAGLNRILALGSPASSPGGSTATMQNPAAQAGQILASGTTSAMNLLSQKTQIANTVADTKVKDAMAAQTAEQTTNLISSRRLTEAEASIKELQLPGVRTEAEFYKWINENDYAIIYKVSKEAAGWAGEILNGLLKKKGIIK